MNEPTLPPLEGEIIESKLIRVGDLIAQLMKLDPNLPVARIDNEYGADFDVEVLEAKLEDFSLSGHEFTLWNLKPGDSYVQIY